MKMCSAQSVGESYMAPQILHLYFLWAFIATSVIPWYLCLSLANQFAFLAPPSDDIVLRAMEVEKEVEERLKAVEPHLSKVLEVVKSVEREDVKVGVVLYLISAIIGESKLPSATTIGILEMVKSAFIYSELSNVEDIEKIGISYV